MKFSLLVLGSPWGGQCADSAWHFARAVVAGGHELYRVFFYHEGIYNGSGSAVAPPAETDRTRRWTELAGQHHTDLVLCVASALKRGLLDEAEADRQGHRAASVHPGFTLSGLGQLIDAGAHSDRLITFGD